MSEQIWAYEKASAYARSLEIKTATAFYRWAAGNDPVKGVRPPGFPSNPHQIYSEWRGIAAFLGTEHIAPFKRRFLPYDDARAFVVALGLESGKEWSRYAAGKIPKLGKRPVNIPSNPDSVYRSAGWRGIRHWLGTGPAVVTGYTRMMSYQEAKEFARTLGLSGLVEWRAYVERGFPHLTPKPSNIPASPNVTYRKRGWEGWGAFLGTGNHANFKRDFLPFKEARAFIRSQKLASSIAWREWCRTGNKPPTVPTNPEKAYASEWRSWADFLGIDQRTQRMRRAALARARYLAGRGRAK